MCLYLGGPENGAAVFMSVSLPDAPGWGFDWKNQTLHWTPERLWGLKTGLFEGRYQLQNSDRRGSFCALIAMGLWS